MRAREAHEEHTGGRGGGILDINIFNQVILPWGERVSYLVKRA